MAVVAAACSVRLEDGDCGEWGHTKSCSEAFDSGNLWDHFIRFFSKVTPRKHHISLPSKGTMQFKRKSLSNRHFSGGEVLVFGRVLCLPYQSLRIIGPFNGEVSELV